jgi:hypothetical protein
MRTTFNLGFGLLLASAVLGSGCGSDRRRGATPEDPLATKTGFCQEWGKKACGTQVMAACLGDTVDACIEAQGDFCEAIVPPNYASENAQRCLDAVGAAYSDARLTAQEYETVIHLGAPCDKLIAGPGQEGSPCRATPECNTLDDLVCVSKPGGSGTCQIPVVQGGGRSCVEPYQLCEKGFYCNGSNCVESRSEGQPCSASEPCAEEMKCAGEEGAKTCAPKGQITNPCATDDDCVSKICAKSGTAATGVCAPQIVLGPADPLCANLRQ